MPDRAATLAPRVVDYFRALDSLDAEAAAGFFAPRATVRLSGTAPIMGRAAIRIVLLELFVAVEDLHHQPVHLFSSSGLSVFEADLTLRLRDSTALFFPVTHITRWVGGMIQEASINVYLESRLALALSSLGPPQ